jgi:phage shock protein A
MPHLADMMRAKISEVTMQEWTREQLEQRKAELEAELAWVRAQLSALATRNLAQKLNEQSRPVIERGKWSGGKWSPAR